MATKKDDDLGQSEVQEKVASAQEKGYIGEEVDPIDNDRYSIKTGPESPTVAEQEAALAKKES
jgi:hypothetical protein